MANSKSKKKALRRERSQRAVAAKKTSKEKTPEPASSPLSSPPPSPPPNVVEPPAEGATSLSDYPTTHDSSANDATQAGPSGIGHPTKVPSNTPNNHGTASNTAARVDTTHEAYRPYILEDLKCREKISVNRFYQTVLGLPAEWETTHLDDLVGIAQKEGFLTKLELYVECVQAVNKETEMYEPFLNFLHYVIDALEEAFTDLKKSEDERLQGAKNDPAYIGGSDSFRKPDAVLSTLRLIRLVSKGDQKTFFWAQLLGFVEFKLVNLKNLAVLLLQSFKTAIKSGKSSPYIIHSSSHKSEDADLSSAPLEAQPHTSVAPPMTSMQMQSLESPTKKSAPKTGSSAASSRNGQFLVPSLPVPRPTPSTSVPPATSVDGSRNRTGGGCSGVSTGSKRSHATMEGPISVDHAQFKKPRIDPESQKYANRYIQCASYALELLSYGGWRSHVIGMLVTDNFMEFIYYDHSIIVQSERLDFCANPFSFIAGIYGLCRLSLSEWGLHPFIQRPLTHGPKTGTIKEDEPLLRTEANGVPRTEMFKGICVKLRDGTVLELEETIHLQHCIIGRGTCMVRVKLKPGIKPESDWATKKLLDDDVEGVERQLVMKLSWPAETRLNEATIVEMARAKAEEDPQHRWVLAHLPDVLYWEDYHKENGKTKDTKGKGKGKATDDTFNGKHLYLSVSSSASLIAVSDLVKALQQRLFELFGDRYERRKLRIIISTELSETYELTDVNDTYNVFYDVFKCECTLSSTKLLVD